MKRNLRAEVEAADPLQMLAKVSRGVLLTTRELAQHNAQLALVRADDRKAVAEKAKAAGLRKIQIRGEDGEIVETWASAQSYRAMGFEDHQIHAAERFETDWAAAYSTIRGQGFEMAVDGSGAPHRVHFVRVDAQTRLAACEAYLRNRAYAIVKSVVIYGATVTGIMRETKRDNRAVKADIEQAFNDLDAFYHDNRRKDPMWEYLERFNQERAELIERAERAVG